MSLPAAEDLPVTHHHNIYPGIEPSKFVGSANGKVVFITGASRGIGEATAVAFAQSGASLFLVSRNEHTLDSVKAEILTRSPKTQIRTYVTDVVDHKHVEAAVEACVKFFGKIDVVISNAGIRERWNKKISEADPAVWWETWEVNVRGSFNVARYSLPYVAKTKGHFLFITSVGAQARFPCGSSYQTSKHAINRLAEFAQQEHEAEGVKVFSVHPGGVKTELSAGPELEGWLNDELPLPAWTMVRLVSGSEDWLAGRYIAVNWDLDEVNEKYKESILRDDALKNKLSMPVL